MERSTGISGDANGTEKGILVAGSGGQGILLLGQMIAYAALQSGLEVTWFPSYGAEMRGGTANCTIVIGTEPIGSPIVKTLDMLIVFNCPSFKKFMGRVRKGGKVFYDSTFVGPDICQDGDFLERVNGLDHFSVRSTSIAKEIGSSKYANMVMFGAFIRHSGLFPDFSSEEVLKRVLPPRHHHLIKQNLDAIRQGYEAS